jgi:hypothetical protein
MPAQQLVYAIADSPAANQDFLRLIQSAQIRGFLAQFHKAGTVWVIDGLREQDRQR